MEVEALYRRNSSNCDAQLPLTSLAADLEVEDEDLIRIEVVWMWGEGIDIG